MKTSKKILIISSLLFLGMGMIAQNQPTFYLRGLLDMWKKSSSNTTANRITKYNALFPAAVRSNVVYSLSAASAWYYTKNPSDYTSYIDDNYLDLCKRVDSTGIPFVVNIAEIGNYPTPMPASSTLFLANPGGYYITTAQVEAIFMNTTNCRGIESGENFWTYSPTTVNNILDMLRVCKKYNKKYIVGEGGWGYSTFVRFFNENYSTLKNEGLGDYLIPVFKNTKPYGALVTQSSVFGAWVSGLTSGFGTWNDEWVWTYTSFRQANEFPIYNKADNTYTFIPYTHYLKSWLLTIAMGGNTAFMESMSFNRDATPLSIMTPYLLPFIKGLAEHNIMPSRAAVLAKVKIMANPYGLHSLSDGTTALYNPTNLISYQTTVVPYKATSISTLADPFGRLYKNTYGIWNDTAYTNTGTVTDRFYNFSSKYTGKNYLLNAVMREVLPNSPRYLLIPLLPHPDAATSVPAGIETVALNALNSDDELKTKFNSLYPSTPNDNGAWAEEIDNSLFVINGNENVDIDQNFAFPLGDTNIESMSGIMPFQNILFGKREGVDNYWFQSNGYGVTDGVSTGQRYVCSIKKTTLTFKCKIEPKIRVENSKESFIQKTWDATTKTLTLRIDHTGGAVNFILVANAEDNPYFVRSVKDTVSWKSQQLATPARVLSITNVSELSKYTGSSTYYLAQGEYLCDNVSLTDSMKIYGGFSGDETLVNPSLRDRTDLDNNGLVEPWEFAHQTIFRGNPAAKNTTANRAMVLEGNSVLDGVTFKSIVGTANLGLISVGTPHAVGALVTMSKGTLRNVIVDGLKSSYQRGIVMITAGSEAISCLLQNDTVSAANGGGAVYLATSGGILKNSVIRNCIANGTTSRGGALCADVPKGNQTKEFTIQNCLIYNNRADNGPVLRQDASSASGASGTVESTLGCQFINCTLFNNYGPTGNALIDVNGVSSRMVNTIVYSEQHDAVRTLASGLMTAINCVTNKAMTNVTAASNGNVVESQLANYKFKQPFTKTYTVVSRTSADFNDLLSSSYLISDNTSAAPVNKGLETLVAYLPGGAANCIPTVDIYNFARPAGGYTLGAFQFGTQTGFVSGISEVRVNELQLYPNPAKGFFYLPTSEDATINIYSVTGELVKGITLSGSRLVNISGLAAGTYIVKAKVGGVLMSSVLIKK